MIVKHACKRRLVNYSPQDRFVVFDPVALPGGFPTVVDSLGTGHKVQGGVGGLEKSNLS